MRKLERQVQDKATAQRFCEGIRTWAPYANGVQDLQQLLEEEGFSIQKSFFPIILPALFPEGLTWATGKPYRTVHRAKITRESYLSREIAVRIVKVLSRHGCLQSPEKQWDSSTTQQPSLVSTPIVPQRMVQREEEWMREELLKPWWKRIWWRYKEI